MRKPKPTDAETTRIFPKAVQMQGKPGKSYETFVSEMFDALIEGAKWVPLNFAKDPDAAHREIERRRAEEADARQNANYANAKGFHGLPKSMKKKMIKAGSPEMSDQEASSKAAMVVGVRRKGISEEEQKRESTKSMIARLIAKRSRKLGQSVPKDVERDIEPNIHAADPKPTNEATSTNDPNRGRMGRKKPLVPPGMMPDDTINPKTGVRVGTFGKLHDRMTNLSPETRKRYRQNYGYRTRVAGRGKRLYPVNEMAQSRPRAEQIHAMLDREDITNDERRRLVALSNKEKRSNKILYGKGGRKMKKSPSVTRGDVFR